MREKLKTSFNEIQRRLILCNEQANGFNPSDVRNTTFKIMLGQVRAYIVLSEAIFLNHDVGVTVSDYENAERRIRYDFFITLFSQFENAIKIIIRALPKNEQVKVYKYVENSVNNEFYDGFNLAKELRNCIHNNGFYFPNDGRDKAIGFNGNNFDLLYGKAVGFLTWELSTDLIVNLIDVLEQVFVKLSIKDVENPIASV